MYRNLAVVTMFVALTGCLTTPPTIPNFPLQEKQKDSDGYYKYATFWFKGTLENGVPNGRGQCHTRYLIDKYNSEWLNAPCEFRAGERIDSLYQKNSEDNLTVTNKIRVEQLREQREEAEEQARAEAEERRERERSRAAFEQNMAASLTGLNQQMMRDYQQMSTMVQKASTPPVRVYMPSASTHSSSKSSSGSSSSYSASSSAKSSSSSSSSSSSGENSNIGEINKKYQTEREKNLKAEEQRKLEQQKAYEAKLVKQQKEREEEERQRQLQLAQEQQEREKLEQKRRDEQAKSDFLAHLRDGIKLQARQCYGNDYVVGLDPKRSSSDPVSGIDVHYRVTCRLGLNRSYMGINRNFIGIGTDCFTGDTTGNQIPEGTLSCKAEDMVVEVTKVTATR